MTPTRDQMKQLEQLAARMSRASRWQAMEAAFLLGLRLGDECEHPPIYPDEHGDWAAANRGLAERTATDRKAEDV